MVARRSRWSCTAASVALVLCAFGCSSRCELDQCDIRDEQCQDAVLQMTLCVRGGEPLDVPVRVVDADAYTDEQVAETEADEDAELGAREYHGLALLRLVSDELSPADATRFDLDRTAAFYSPDDKAITILDRGSPLDAFGAAMTLVHEYVHALQDEEHGIADLYDGGEQTLDGALAVSAMIEGEASLYQAQAAATTLGYELDDIDFPRAFSAYRGSSRGGLAMTDNPFIHLYSFFAYAYGGTYVDAAYRDGGSAAVAALFDDLPRSSRQVIAGYGEPPPGGEPWLEPALDEEGVPVIGASYVHVSSMHAGSYALWAFLDRWVDDGIRDPIEFEPIQQLRGDVLSIFDRGDGSVIAAWRLRFSDARYARELVDRLQPTFDAGGSVVRRSWVEDRDVFLVAGRDEITELPEFTTLDWSAIPPEH